MSRLKAFRAWVRQTRTGRILWRAVISIVGVGLLSSEYDWARRLLSWTRRWAADLAAKARRRKRSAPR